jgi:hypothetical protein
MCILDISRSRTRRLGRAFNEGCMFRLRLSYKWVVLPVVFYSLLTVVGCGGHTPAGIAPFPGKITLSPAGAYSLQIGSIVGLSATAQNAAGGNVSTGFTWASTDSSILNISPTGLACAGQWLNASYTVCTPGNIGVVEVTASALGASSEPTLIYVHPPIDSMTVTGVVYNGVIPQEPCLSQGQSMTVEAHAYSQGTDITSAVGTFTWSANNANVVKITPIIYNVIYNGFTFNVATNQATLTANNPGLTQIYASASNAYSTSFQQPQYQYQGNTSPVLDFFETCNIASVQMGIGGTANQVSTQTTFLTSKGTSESTAAVVTDIMGNSSQTNTSGQVLLNKIPLTWTASQPADVATSSSCTLSCNLTTPSPGAGAVSASCSPPTCNIGFPYVPPSLSTPALISACDDFFKPQFAPFVGCAALIPTAVYPTPPGPPPATPPVGAVTGIVTGTPSAATVLATSTGCANVAPDTCQTSVYDLATSKGVPGGPNLIPSSPNSILFDPPGDKAYMGSEFGALLITPANFNTGNSPYTSLGSVNGQALAVSNNGTSAVFSDTVHNPNQVYVVNAASTNSVSAVPLNISGAIAAGFSPDGLKAFILGNSGLTLYVYSPLQTLQGPGLQGPGSNPQLALAQPANSVAFSPNGAFAFVDEGYPTGGGANLTAFSVCDNSLAGTVTLPAQPLLMQVLPGAHIDGLDSRGLPIPDGVHVFLLDSTGFDIVTYGVSLPTAGNLCPEKLTPLSPAPGYQRIELQAGTLHPVNFFASADNSLLYIPVFGSNSVLVYGFETGGLTGIQLGNNATPLTAAITADATAILISGSDGMLHQLDTGLGGQDVYPVQFPDLPNVLDPFCTFNPTSGPCSLNLLAVKP